MDVLVDGDCSHFKSELVCGVGNVNAFGGKCMADEVEVHCGGHGLFSLLIVDADGDCADVIVEEERAFLGIDEEADASEADDFIKDDLYVEGNVVVEVGGGVGFDVTLDDLATDVSVGAFVEHAEQVVVGEVGLEFLDLLFYVWEVGDGGVLLVDCDFHDVILS